MSDLVLTDSRRNELIELLEDEPRLRKEHPQVADYLSVAPGLGGSGDEEADAAFDLRIAHYLTDASGTTANPYWHIIEPAITIRSGISQVDGGSAIGSPRLAYAQMLLQDAYAYAIPSPSTVRWIAQFCDSRPIIELGAGRGYWAYQLRAAGLEVMAYDVAPPNGVSNGSFSTVKPTWGTVYPADQLDLKTATSERVLFLCWPPGWGDSMAVDALKHFEAGGGDRLVYIGEPKGGKTASSRFFDRLAENWELASSDDHYVSWWNLSDRAEGWIYRGRTQSSLSSIRNT